MNNLLRFTKRLFSRTKLWLFKNYMWVTCYLLCTTISKWLAEFKRHQGIQVNSCSCRENGKKRLSPNEFATYCRFSHHIRHKFVPFKSLSSNPFSLCPTYYFRSNFAWFCGFPFTLVLGFPQICKDSSEAIRRKFLICTLLAAFRICRDVKILYFVFLVF